MNSQGRDKFMMSSNLVNIRMRMTHDKMLQLSLEAISMQQVTAYLNQDEMRKFISLYQEAIGDVLNEKVRVSSIIDDKKDT